MEGVGEVASGRLIEEVVWKDGRIWRERQGGGERSPRRMRGRRSP